MVQKRWIVGWSKTLDHCPICQTKLESKYRLAEPPSGPSLLSAAEGQIQDARYRGALMRFEIGDQLSCWMPENSIPKRAKYLRSRSASFENVFRAREAPNKVRPASDRERLCRHTSTTIASCARSKKSRFSSSFGRSNSSSRLEGRKSAGSPHDASSLLISSSTIGVEIRPPGARVAMRATAALRSRKLPDQLAVGESAKARNLSRASLLKVTRRPTLSAKRSSSKSRFGSMSSARSLRPGSKNVHKLMRASKSSRNLPWRTAAN